MIDHIHTHTQPANKPFREDLPLYPALKLKLHRFPCLDGVIGVSDVVELVSDL